MKRGNSGHRGQISAFKHRKQFLASAAISSLALCAIGTRHAGAQLYWDLNAASTGAGGTSPSGTWDTTSSNWTTDSTGASATGLWTGGTTPVQAVFAAGADATGAYTVTLSLSTTINGVNGIKFEEGTITINSDAASKLVLTDPTISTLGTQTINANIGGTVGLTRASGTLVLTLGGNNTYTGVTTINTGRVTITTNTALGSSAAADYTTFAPAVNGLGVNLSGDGLNIPEPIILSGGSGSTTNVGPGQIENLGGNNVWSGQITLAGSTSNSGTGLAMIGVTAGTLTISSPMVPLNPVASTISAFAKSGAGTLILAASSSYTGLTRVFGGTVVAQVNGAFGTIAGGIAMASGASAYQPEMILLQPAASAGAGASLLYTNAEGAGTLAGTNYAGHGLLESSAGIGVGSNVYSGAIALGNNDPFGSQDINVVQPTTIGVASGTLTLNGTGIANSSLTDQRSLVKVGAGELRLQTAGTFAGPTIVDTGTLSFWGSAGGANGLAAISSNFTVNAGASLKYENTANIKANRITAQGGPVRLFGGDFTMSGFATAAVTTVNVGSELDAYGTSSITMTSPGAGAVLDLSAATSPAPFNRMSNATVVFRGAALGTAASGTGISTVRLPAALQTLVGSGSAGTPNVGIIPWAVGDTNTATGTGTDFVTYDTVNNPSRGVRLLTGSEYNDTATIPIDGSSGNVLVSTASAPISNATTVNAIKFALSGNSLALGNQLNLTSGAILNATGGAVSITGTGPLQFGSAEGVIHTNTDMSISAPVAGSNGLTKGGAGNLTLTNTSNNFGALTLDAGKVTIDDESEIGGGSTPITINGGFLAPTSALTSMTGHSITMASAGGFFVQNGSSLAVAGLTGTGTLENKGPGTLILSDHDNSSFTGGIELRAGTIEINGDSNLGGTTPTSVGHLANNSLVLRFDGGALRVSSGSFGLATERNIYLNSTGTFDVAGGGTLQTNSYLFGPGGLAKTGDGTMILQSRGGTQNKFIGNVQILGGTLAYADALSQNFTPALLVPNYWFIDNNAALQLNFSPLSVASRGITLGANGGNISVPSGVTQTFTAITGTGFLGKAGDGTLLMTTAEDYQGGTKVKGGFLAFTNDNQLGTAGSDVTLDGGTLVFNTLIGMGRNIIVTANSGTILNDATSSANNTGHSITGPGVLSKYGSALFSTNVIQTGGLNLQGGTLQILSGRNTATKTNTLSSLNISGGTTLNLNDNDLVYNYGSSPDSGQSSTIHSLLASGYDNDAWDGTGIMSGSAKTDNANAAKPKLGLGYAEASSAGIISPYNLKPVTGGSIIIRYTYEGDANLDGIVNALDFNALATNYGTNSGANWVQGDYNYDGSVDSNDFGLLADNFGQNAPLPGDLPDAALPAEGAAPLASLGSIVPEPASLSLIGMATLGLLARRRRSI